MIMQKPLFGWGNISTSNMANILNHQSFVNSHNQWLDILVQTGIVGFIVFISFFGLLSGRLT
jgi:O-antigen ligase